MYTIFNPPRLHPARFDLILGIPFLTNGLAGKTLHKEILALTLLALSTPNIPDISVQKKGITTNLFGKIWISTLRPYRRNKPSSKDDVVCSATRWIRILPAIFRR